MKEKNQLAMFFPCDVQLSLISNHVLVEIKNPRKITLSSTSDFDHFSMFAFLGFVNHNDATDERSNRKTSSVIVDHILIRYIYVLINIVL